MIKIGTALFEATEQLEREKGISKDVIISSLCDALVAAYKKHIRAKEAPNVEAILDESTGEIGVFRTKLVVENVEDENLEISLADAKEISDDVELEDEVKIEVTPENFGRIAAQAAKQVITQRIREAERNLVLAEFMDKKGTLTTGIIQRVENRNVYVKGDGATDKTLKTLEATANIKTFWDGIFNENNQPLDTNVDDGSLNITVINKVGSKLPVTGSGATIALIGLGSTLMTGALAVSRKKSKK